MIGFVSGVSLGRSSFTPAARCATPKARFAQSAALRMRISVGDEVPMDMTLNVDGENKSTSDIFKGKKVAICAIPGALTPTCQEVHAPSFVNNADTLRGKGIDDIYILSVNDQFVMKVFAKVLGAEGKVGMIADGDAAYSKAIGLIKETGAFGGTRAQRYSMLVNDGTVALLNSADTSDDEIWTGDFLLGQMVKSEDPLLAFCADSPEADECRTYDN